MTQLAKHAFHRRRFLQSAGAAGALATVGVWSERSARASRSANEKLNIAAVGTGGMAGVDLENLAYENIVGICDVDDNQLGQAAQKYPRAAKYNDFRQMLEKEQSRIDAVMVATPDHVHAAASVMAMRLGKHCFCEKPLAWSVNEVRLMRDLAAEKKLATQMGINIHAQNNYRRVVEIIQAGTIGTIQEVVVWCGKDWGGGKRPTQVFEVPATLKWDLWIGPAPARPYAPGVYEPREWRRWWDFGCGTLGDMACHLVDLPVWALDLKGPTSIEAEGPPVDRETTPLGLTVRYEFAATTTRPALQLTWHDGNHIPQEVAGHKVGYMGIMFLGEKGQLYADYGSYKLYPEEQFKGFTPPPQTIPNSVGHWKEWTDACRSGAATTCNFDYSAALSETVLLGNVAYRAGKKLAWDTKAGTVTDCPEANQYLGREYRKGWTL